MDTTSSNEAEEAVKPFQVILGQRQNTEARKPKSHNIKQWYGSITSSAKPFHNLRAKLRPTNLNENVEKTELNSSPNSLRVDSIHTAEPSTDGQTNAHAQSATHYLKGTTTSRMQFQKQDRYAVWQPMSGPFPTMLPSRPQSMPPTRSATTGTWRAIPIRQKHGLAPNRYKSVRMRSSMYHDAPRSHHDWVNSPSQSIFWSAPSLEGQITCPPSFVERERVVFTQAALHAAFARKLSGLVWAPSTTTPVQDHPLSHDSSTSPHILVSGSENQEEDAVEALFDEVDVAAEEGSGSEIIDEDLGSGEGESAYEDAEEYIGDIMEELQFLLNEPEEEKAQRRRSC
ncbi:hypothetical protein T440DRAFT_526803 [Plenodomus tracheiphilus IPT5]|uniref:Uncharacterized protein n=1 Tax=Plenodomus tracheiphilus IPT5 TaxID=1408161 RepID=A0A6A7BC00_9PLEO|nr:hypothetical protein T440DRAFT_526803 [Plenodomus tracheiphilus IPT5]